MFDFAATVLSNMKIKYGSGFSEPLIWQLKETCYAPFYKMLVNVPRVYMLSFNSKYPAGNFL